VWIFPKSPACWIGNARELDGIGRGSGHSGDPIHLKGTPELLLILEMMHQLEAEKMTMTLTHRDERANDSNEDAKADAPYEVNPPVCICSTLSELS